MKTRLTLISDEGSPTGPNDPPRPAERHFPVDRPAEGRLIPPALRKKMYRARSLDSAKAYQDLVEDVLWEKMCAGDVIGFDKLVADTHETLDRELTEKKRSFWRYLVDLGSGVIAAVVSAVITPFMPKS